MATDEEMAFLKSLLAQEKEKNSRLQTALACYKNTFSEITPAIVTTTPNGTITFFNTAFLSYFTPVTPAELAEKELAGLSLWTQPEQIRHAIAKAVHENSFSTMVDITNNTHAGCEYQLSVFALKGEKGDTQQLLFRMYPTEMQEAQDLQLDEEKIKTILDIAPLGVSFFSTDEQKPAFVNNLLLQTLGYSKHHISTVSLPEIFPADFFQRLLAQLGLQPQEKKHFRAAVEFKHKEGKAVFFNTISDFVRINKRNYLFSFYREVTEEKKIHDLLIRREESLRQAQKIAKVGNWEWNIADNTRYYSDELFHIHSLTPSENFSYQTFIELVHPEDREKVATNIQAALNHYHSYDIEFKLLMHTGQIKYLHGVSQLFLDEAGNPEKMIGTLQDISEQVIAREALRKSESRLKRAQQIGKTGYWEWNILTNEVYWSDELYAMYQMPKETFVPTINSVIEMMHESEREHATEHIFDCIHKKLTYFEIEGRIVTGNGLVKYFIARAEIIYDQTGQSVRMEGVSQDITSIKAVEDALRFKDYLLQNVNDAIFSTDASMKITSWNKAAEKIYGWTMQEVLGKSLQEIIDFEPLPVDGKTHQSFMEKGYWQGEHMLKKKDNTPITIQAHTILLKNSDQQIAGMVSVDRDVTEYNALLQKVIESEKMLQLVINSVPQSIFWKDTHSVYIGCNDNFARLASLSSPAEVAGKTDADMPWTEEKASAFIQYDKDILREGKPRLNRIITLTLKDGSTRWQNVNIVPLQDASGKNIGILGTIDDITERKSIEEKLSQKQANLEAIIENTDSLIWSVSKAYTVLAMNSKFVQFNQQFFNKELQLGDNYLAYLPDGLEKRWIDNHQKVLSGTKINLTRKFKFNNSYVWFDIFCFPIMETNGCISGVAYMARDVSERIKNEQLILKYIKQHNVLKLQQEKLKMQAVLHGQEEERKKISMELHDGVGQLQTALLYKMNKLTDKMHVYNNSEINNLARDITSLQKDIYHEIRRISEHLMPQYLNDFPLDKALMQLLLLSFQNTDIKVDSFIKLSSIAFSKSLEIAVFRIVQEIINNVVKHAQAKLFFIKLYNSKRSLHLEIKDNGIGFDPQAMHNKRGRGLTHIKERVNLLNGKFSIVTNPGEGCYINITIPIF